MAKSVAQVQEYILNPPPKGEAIDSNVTVVGEETCLLKGALTNPPIGKKITKNEFTHTEDDNVETIKFYEGEEIIFTLTFLWNPDGTLNQIVRT